MCKKWNGSKCFYSVSITKPLSKSLLKVPYHQGIPYHDVDKIYFHLGLKTCPAGPLNLWEKSPVKSLTSP